MSVLFPFKLAARLLFGTTDDRGGSRQGPPSIAATVSDRETATSPQQPSHCGNRNQQLPAPLVEHGQQAGQQANCASRADQNHAAPGLVPSEFRTFGCNAQTAWGVNGVDNVSPNNTRNICNINATVTPSTITMASETAGNGSSTKDDAVNPWVQYYLDSTAAALGTRPAAAADHLVPGPTQSSSSSTHASLALPSTDQSAGGSPQGLEGQAQTTAPTALAPTATCLAFAPTAPTAAGTLLGSSVAEFQGHGVISSSSGASTFSGRGVHVQSRSAFLLNPNNTRVPPLTLSATAQALLAGSARTLTPTPTPTQAPTLHPYSHHVYHPMYYHHQQAMYPPQFQHPHQHPGQIPAHSAAQQPGYYPPQPHPLYQHPQYQHYAAPPPTMYYSTGPAPSPPLAPSPLAPPTTPPPPSASPTHFAQQHQHAPTWPPSPTDPILSAPPAPLNPTNYLLSLASISLAVLQPFLFYQATGSPSASAALRRSSPAALVPKAITSVLITLFISCVMIPAFLTATAVAWARAGKQQALRDMREVVLVVHSRWMGDDLKHITRPLAQGLTVLGNVIEHAPSVSLTPGLVRAAMLGVGPAAGLRDVVVQRVLRVAATGAPSMAVLVQYLSPLVPRQVLASVVAAVLSAAGGSAAVPVAVPVVGGEGATIQEVRGKERSPRTHRKSKASGESAKSPKKRKSAGAGSSKTSSGSSRASDSGKS